MNLESTQVVDRAIDYLYINATVAMEKMAVNETRTFWITQDYFYFDGFWITGFWTIIALGFLAYNLGFFMEWRN